MNAAAMPTDEERTLLRDSLRGFLQDCWPADTAVERARDPEAVRGLWRQVAEQGVASLCMDPSEGGLREAVIALEELGRAAAPAPLLGAIGMNLLLGARAGEHRAIESLMEKVHAGDASVSLALGAADGDPNAGALTASGGKVSGTLAFVEGAVSATHLLVYVEVGPTVGIVACDDPAVEVVETEAFGTGGLAEVRLTGAAAELIPVSADEIADVGAALRVCLVGRALGAADRAFEMAVDYAKVRKQFGRLIGSFQAIQHKLASCLIGLDGIRHSLHSAAAGYDTGASEWRVFAEATYAFAGQSMRQISLETHHAFGAIGYSEEHEAPRHFRRIHMDLLRAGGPGRSREALAAELLEGSGHLPEYDLGEAGNAFRKEVRDWLAEHWNDERKAKQAELPFHERDFDREFSLELGKTGWLAMNWPKEFGGQERTPFEQLAFVEEIERAEAPRAGAPIQAPAFMVYGTKQQQERYLPAIKNGEMMFGLGYSEPESGSDLASMRTRAERDGDEWVINGQKIWTTTWWGDHMWLAARTDPDARPKQAGLSVFIVPMDAPGITVRTIETMYSGNFANVFYDNVRVPADALVGKVNEGWKVVNHALSTERGLIAGMVMAKLNHVFGLVCEYLRTAEVNGRLLKDDPVIRDRIGGLAAEIEVGRQMVVNLISRIEDGTTPIHEAGINKVYSGELMERFYEQVIELLGMRATLSENAPGSILAGRLEQRLRHSLMWVISLGTNEIQRTLIARRGLDLPKE